MNIYVCIKQVPDTETKIKLNADATGIDPTGIKWIVSPYDEFAIEEALRLRDKNPGSTVTVLSAGPSRTVDAIRTALAMGADRAILVQVDDGVEVEPLAVAKLLKAIADEEGPGLVILGKQAIDDDSNQTGQMLAALLGWPQGTFASKVEFDGSKVNVTREVDGGLQTVALDLPAIITTDLRLNEPRYASLPNIMKAKKKPIDVKAPADFGVDVTPRLKVVKVTEPPKRQGGVKVKTVQELVDKLKNEAGVL
jgi:electron transfer flavoprotein beta subunit